jgi:murein DD-endopeptidase MepM/ murein hydrolase activator NlpD
LHVHGPERRALEFVKCDDAKLGLSAAFCSVRRQRSFHKTFTFVAITLGVAAAPAVASATTGDDVGAVADPSADAPAAPASQPDPGPAPAPRPDPEQDPEPQPDPEPTTLPTAAPRPAIDPASEPTAESAPAPTTPPSAEHLPPAVGTESPAPSSTSAVDEASLPEQPAQDDGEGIDGITRPIAFPVLGPVRYSNDFGACRDGCARHHKGNDMIGVRMQPLLAAVDGTVTKISLENQGISGVSIRITGDDGWYYGYYHVNNDTPGSDDGRATTEWQVQPGLSVGSRVRAGQVIGYMGDSGNAEFSVPHLHFEIRTPDHTPVNPYHSLIASQRRETCAPNAAWTNTPLEDLSSAAVAVIPLADGGRWVIDADGRLHAEGPAARIEPAAGVDCAIVPPVAPAPAGPSAATPIAAPSSPTPSADVPAPAVAEPAAPAPAGDRWTVEPGDTLWHIVRRSYHTTDRGATAAMVGFVFERNRDQLTDPNLLDVGMQLELPPFGA